MGSMETAGLQATVKPEKIYPGSKAAKWLLSSKIATLNNL
jgi:hypothetical protein